MSSPQLHTYPLALYIISNRVRFEGKKKGRKGITDALSSHLFVFIFVQFIGKKKTHTLFFFSQIHISFSFTYNRFVHSLLSSFFLFFFFSVCDRWVFLLNSFLLFFFCFLVSFIYLFFFLLQLTLGIALRRYRKGEELFFFSLSFSTPFIFERARASLCKACLPLSCFFPFSDFYFSVFFFFFVPLVYFLRRFLRIRITRTYESRRSLFFFFPPFLHNRGFFFFFY